MTDGLGEPTLSGHLPPWPDRAPLTFDHEPILDQVAADLGAPYSDWHFSSIWCWDVDKTATLSRCGPLVVLEMADYSGVGRMVSVAGRDESGESICQVLESVDRVQLVPEPTATPWMMDSRLDVVADVDAFDYAYDLKAQVARLGSEFAWTRRHLRRFRAAVPDARVELLDLGQPRVVEAIRAIFEAWADSSAGPDPDPERTAMTTYLQDASGSAGLGSTTRTSSLAITCLTARASGRSVASKNRFAAFQGSASRCGTPALNTASRVGCSGKMANRTWGFLVYGSTRQLCGRRRCSKSTQLGPGKSQ